MKNFNAFRVVFVGFLVFFSPFTISMVAAQDAEISRDMGNYILGSEDIVEVLVWKEPDVSKVVMIRPDGNISLPLIGDIQAEGLKAEELKTNIAEKLKEFISNPTVSVIVSQINSMKIFIQGEVAQPGVYQLRSNITVLQAVSLAGGFNEWAKKKKIIVIREAGGKVSRITVDYNKIVSGKDIEQNIFLKRGDTIIVP